MNVTYMTFVIMLITFAIGFIVAGLIAVIVPINDMTTFYQTHGKAYKRLLKIEKVRRKQIKSHLFDVADKSENELVAHYYASHLPQNKFENDTNEMMEHYYPKKNKEKKVPPNGKY